MSLTVPLDNPSAAPDTYGPGRVRMDIDPSARQLCMSGEWWYRGVYTVTDDPQGSAVHYAVYNIAPAATRWIVPLIQRGLDARARGTLADALRLVGDYLNRPTRIAGG
jgi:hypothetical protein